MENGNIAYIMFALLLLAFTSLQLVSAVDIVFWSLNNCQGAGAGCVGIAANRCCRYDPNRSSVEFKYTPSCKGVRAYGYDNGCGTQVGAASGSGCFTGAAFSGGKWVNSLCRRRLLADVADHESEECGGSHTPCTEFVKPNAVFYRDPSSKGVWKLNKNDVTGLYEKFTSLPDSDKVAWLTKHGATLESETEKKIIYTVKN